MTKIVVSLKRIFALSRPAFLRLRELVDKGALEEPDIGESWSDEPGYVRDEFNDMFGMFIERTSPALIQVVEELGGEAASYHGALSPLTILEIPDDVKWHIQKDEFGREWIAEDHRTWPECAPGWRD